MRLEEVDQIQRAIRYVCMYVVMISGGLSPFSRGGGVGGGEWGFLNNL